MKKAEGRGQARITVFNSERELFCRVRWPEGFTDRERHCFLEAIANELDKLMREQLESERDITKSG